jgi:O-antigen/teichoic acid export membrane protein
LERKTGKNIWYNLINTITLSASGFIFWIVAAKITNIETIGLTTAINSLVLIIVAIVVMDTSFGMKRYLGIAISQGDTAEFKHILMATVILVSIMIITSSIILTLPQLQILERLGIDREYMWIILAIMVASVFQRIFSEALIAGHSSKNLIMPTVLASIIRIPLLLVAVYIFNELNYGVIIAYSLPLFVTAIFYFVYSTKIFKNKQKKAQNWLYNIKLVFHAGIVSWIPHTLDVLGSQLAILSVFTIGGAASGGRFYMPMAIFTLTLVVINGINKVSHPLIGSMTTNEQNSHLSYVMKLSFLLTIPIIIPLMYFSDNFLNLIGNEFRTASNTLTILMICVPFAIISEVVYYFIYGKGDHKTLLYLGLVGNIPRAMLYFLLIPEWGSDGGAIAYLVGTVVQFIFTIKIGFKQNLKLIYREYVIIIIIPFLIGSVMWLLNFNYLLSTGVILIGSLIGYIKLHLFTNVELKNVLFSSLPAKTAEKLYFVFSKILNKIN